MCSLDQQMWACVLADTSSTHDARVKLTLEVGAKLRVSSRPGGGIQIRGSEAQTKGSSF